MIRLGESKQSWTMFRIQKHDFHSKKTSVFLLIEQVVISTNFSIFKQPESTVTHRIIEDSNFQTE